MTTHNFDNDATQAVRKAIVKNDSYITSERNTYLSRTDPDDEAGGRFKKEIPTKIIGASPALQYPRLPPSSPWASPCPTGVEPVLGIDINAVPDLGFHEAPSNSGEASASPPLAVETSPTFSNKLRRRV